MSTSLLYQLLQAESTERSIRSIRYQTQVARFQIQRHLQDFDFSQSKVDQQLIH
ncbi:ATP-binding protein [Nitrosomonas supralitoralis]|uniref:ATP-binding protein n=1 Tax=Nitrosomonas supralitoralis TaxID=2116706 RepID=UPI00215EE3D7|nr:ATP-binding protein [Nitrosomonas supralitoralis]